MVWILRKEKDESNILYKRKSIAKQCMVRRTKRHNKGERERKECQKNIQNLKRSIAEY